MTSPDRRRFRTGCRRLKLSPAHAHRHDGLGALIRPGQAIGDRRCLRPGAPQPHLRERPRTLPVKKAFRPHATTRRFTTDRSYPCTAALTHPARGSGQLHTGSQTLPTLGHGEAPLRERQRTTPGDPSTCTVDLRIARNPAVDSRLAYLPHVQLAGGLVFRTSGT